MQIQVESEIGILEGVILHSPGSEVENMTPESAKRALYSDILNLNVATNEYSQLEGVLNKVTKTFQVQSLLKEVLTIDKVKNSLINKICNYEDVNSIKDYLIDLKEDELSRQLIQGVVMKKNNLTKFLDKERYELQPLHNFFFTRDSSVAMFDTVLISRMANRVRERESLIMETIFNYHPNFNSKTINPLNLENYRSEISMEGGDILIAREDVLIIGISTRTTSQGIDYIIEHFKNKRQKLHIIAQELPYTPESFIHLDMTFTFLDKNYCMVYEPLIINSSRFLTIHIEIDNGNVSSIYEEINIISALNKIGFDIKPLYCGSKGDKHLQEREQWHSGANFFAFAPGKVIGYNRNTNTIDELSKNGFEVIKATDIIDEKIDINLYNKCVVTIAGSELSRGGGGCRCMTMPVNRKKVDW